MPAADEHSVLQGTNMMREAARKDIAGETVEPYLAIPLFNRKASFT
jgi:hypothetical protein